MVTTATSDTDPKVLESMIRKAEQVQTTGTRAGMVVDPGGENTAKTIVSSIKGPDLVYIYDTQTGDRSITNKNKLMTDLKKKRPDGSYVFTVDKPSFEPLRGKMKCYLHPDNDYRKHYDELGLPVCKKSNLQSIYQVEMHMKRRHPSAWNTIESERKEREKTEEREFQRSIISMARGQPEPKQEAQPVVTVLKCDQCDFVAKSESGLYTHKKAHK